MTNALQKPNCGNYTATKNRLEYLDVAKAILILLMVLGHIFLEGPVRQFIYTFHMPAFLIISGIQYHYSSALRKSPIGFLKSRLYSLIVPFLIYELVGVGYHIICFGMQQNAFGYLHNTLTQNWNNGPAGFLVHLFGAECVMYASLKLIHKIMNLLIESVLLFILSFSIPANAFSILQIIGIYAAFGILGYAVFSADKWSVLVGAAALVISAVVSLQGIYISSCFGRLDLAAIYLVGAIAGSYAVLTLSNFIHSKLLNWLGQNTLIILGTHNLILFPVRHFLFPNTSGFIGILVFFIILTAEIPIILFINRFLPFLSGKSKHCSQPLQAVR